MRQIFIFIILFLFVESATSQVTFNLRERYNFEACILTSIIATDSCYYATGLIADTIFPYLAGAIFIKLDLEGNPSLIKTIKSSSKTYETWYKGLSSLADGGFIVAGYTIDTTFKALLIKYNKLGDTVFTKEYSSPYYPGELLIVPSGGCQLLADGGYIVSNWIQNNFGTNYYFIRIDSLGNKLWGKIYGTSMMERPESLAITTDGKIVAGGIRDNTNTNTQDYTFQCHIFQIDTAGNEEWAYTSPVSLGLRDAANDMLLLDDGSIIVASGVGYEQERPSVNELYFDRHVFKLNPQHEIEWEVTFPDSALTSWAKTTSLVELQDGSGYIVAGMTYNAQPPPKYFTIRGWLAKISTEGDSIWSRRYAFLTDGENEHKVFDMKETADGGLILCGQSFDWDDDAFYPQQAWLLKLDQYGCLVPGCQLTDATGETEADIRLAIYPNPTSDYLNFYLRTPRPVKEAGFRIVDVEGKLIKSFQSDRPDATFIVPVWEWAAGVYFLQYIEDGFVMASERFVVSK